MVLVSESPQRTIEIPNIWEGDTIPTLETTLQNLKEMGIFPADVQTYTSWRENHAGEKGETVHYLSKVYGVLEKVRMNAKNDKEKIDVRAAITAVVKMKEKETEALRNR